MQPKILRGHQSTLINCSYLLINRALLYPLVLAEQCDVLNS